MHRTRIKFCGVMRPEDALLAARHGADAVGMIFYPQARRYVTPDVARKIVQALPAFVTPVAVFVNESADAMRDLAGDMGIRTLQLHGDETPETVASLRDFCILKAVRVDRDHFGSTLKLWRDAIRKHDLTHLRGLVLETGGTSQHGGTGMANDWASVRDSVIAGLWSDLPPMIAAGGLTAQTVGAVVREIRPWAVDVSSGVEASLGVKSEEKIAAFVRSVQLSEV